MSKSTSSESDHDAPRHEDVTNQAPEPSPQLSVVDLESLIPAGNAPATLSSDCESRLLKERESRRKDLAAQSETIQLLYLQLERAEANQNILKSELKVFNRLFDPIRLISNEILQEVFLHCINLDEYERIQTDIPPWTLAQVSRKWRRCALAFPKLWSKVNVRVFGPQSVEEYTEVESDCGRPVRITKTLCTKFHAVESLKLGMYLSRSGTMPLHIRISHARKLTEHHPLVPLLFSSASRWASLSIDFPPSNLATVLPIQGSLSLLSSLHFDFAPDSSGQWEYGGEDLKLFKYATNLRSLHALSPFVGYFDLPQWDSLTHIRTQIVPPDGDDHCHLDLLSWAENARSCHFDLVNIVQTRPRAVMPHLHIMELTVEANLPELADSEDNLEATNVLSKLSLPKLDVLRLIVPQGFERLSAFHRFLKRSGCTIRALELVLPAGFLTFPAVLRASSKYLTKLEKLLLYSTEKAAVITLLEDLTHHSEDYFGNLKILEVKGVALEEFDAAQLKSSRHELKICFEK
jgi:hypothetical protein